ETLAPAHGLKGQGAVNGTNLTDAQHGARDRRLKAHRVGYQSPDVGVRLQDQRRALDGGGVGAFAAFTDSLLDQFLRVGQLGDAQACGTLATEVVGEPRAICSLREHAGKRELTDPTGSGEQQRMRHATAPKRAAQSRYNAIIAEEFGETHVSHLLTSSGRPCAR